MLNASVSESFSPHNGVKQGSILSPMLFALYMDVLIEKLKNLGYGCNIGTKYYGALAYADDLILLSPSVKGLQEMINLCESYGKEYNVTFNEEKQNALNLGIIIKVTLLFICQVLNCNGKMKLNTCGTSLIQVQTTLMI